MRDIKFRAWNNVDKRMIGWSVLGLIFSSSTTKSHYYNVMQYTGLKDNSGVEIYEGDIVRIAGIGNCEVRWRDWYLGFMFCMESEDYELFSVIEDIEKVVGNIHKNSNLLD